MRSCSSRRVMQPVCAPSLRASNRWDPPLVTIAYNCRRSGCGCGGLRGRRWHLFLTIAGMVGVVTAVLAGIGLGCLVAVVLDRASALQVLLEDRLHVQRDRDLVADHHTATGQMVLPRHAEVVAVDRGRGREADPPQGAAVLLAHPVGRLPLAVVGHVQDHRPGDPPDGQVDAGLGVHVPGALDDVAGEGDPGMVLDVEEVGAAEVRVACLFAGPDPGGVDLAVEGRLQRTVPVELDRAVDVLEEAAHPGDHHVPRAELRLGVAGLENPAAHRWILSSGPTGCHPPADPRVVTSKSMAGAVRHPAAGGAKWGDLLLTEPW